MAVSFQRVNATDTLQKGAVYRVTYERGFVSGVVSRSAQSLWQALEGSAYPVFRVSPIPANGAVAVIDVKARTDAPSQSVGAMANAIDDFTGWSVTRVELLDSEAMSTKQAADARTSLTIQTERQRGFENPLSRIGDAIGAAKWIAIAAIVGIGAYLFLQYGPRPKRRGR